MEQNGGAGARNPKTGLLEFFWGGDSDPDGENGNDPDGLDGNASGSYGGYGGYAGRELSEASIRAKKAQKAQAPDIQKAAREQKVIGLAAGR